MSARLGKRSARWVEEIDKLSEESGTFTRTPWWDELKRCSEGNIAPLKSEGWNHPVSGPILVLTW